MILAVTVYSTLGEDAVKLAINETGAETVVVNQELVQKVLVSLHFPSAYIVGFSLNNSFSILQNVLPSCKTVKRLIYMESRIPGTKPVAKSNLSSLSNDFQLMTFGEVEKLGNKNCKLLCQPFETLVQRFIFQI